MPSQPFDPTTNAASQASVMKIVTIPADRNNPPLPRTPAERARDKTTTAAEKMASSTRLLALHAAAAPIIPKLLMEK